MKNLKTITNKITLKAFIITTFILAVMLWLIDFSPVGGGLMSQVAPNAQLLDYDCAYSLEECYWKLDSMGEAGRYVYLHNILPIDIIYPPALMSFLFSLLCLLVKNVSTTDSKLLLLPFLAVIYMMCDWGENIGIFLMLKNFPAELAGICLYTGTVSTVKVLCILSILISIIVLTMALIVKKLKNR